MSFPNITPMTLAQHLEPFDHPEWLFELKSDRFRALAHVREDGAVRLVSRKGSVYKSFPELCAGLGRALAGREAVLDGEIVHLDSQGRPQFYDLLRRRRPTCFCAFDLVWLNGRDLRGLQLVERKRMLRELVPAGCGALLYVGHVEERGRVLFQAACKMDL